jgi:hypothetical protein
MRRLWRRDHRFGHVQAGYSQFPDFEPFDFRAADYQPADSNKA